MVKKKNNTPRRRNYTRSGRLQNAKKWAEQDNGSNLAKGYSKWFGVDLLCAIKELEMLGYKFKESYKEQIKNSLIARQEHKEQKKRERVREQEYFEDGFYFIAGYTSNGVPYGITYDEIDESSSDEHETFIDDDVLPF